MTSVVVLFAGDYRGKGWSHLYDDGWFGMRDENSVNPTAPGNVDSVIGSNLFDGG